MCKQLTQQTGSSGNGDSEKDPRGLRYQRGFSLFKALEVRIVLPDGAQLNAVHILCRFLISFMKPGKELDRMGAKFIEKMTKRTKWYIPMLPNICVNLRWLNKAVKRVRFILLMADEITVELNRSTVFSPLDAAM